MQAVYCTKYGSPEVLQVTEAKKPTPKANEVLVKIVATAVTASDIIIRSSSVSIQLLIPMRLIVGITKPRQPVLGLVFAGDVAAVGDRVTRFNVGDAVYGFTGYDFATYAEYTCRPQDSCIALKPSTLSYEDATGVAYGGLLGSHYVQKGNIQPGHKVLIYGASGSIGTFAVQLAKHFGGEVTGVCSTSNLEMVKSLGADHVNDYTTQDVVPVGVQYDFILDAVGKKKTSTLKEQCRHALLPTGTYVSVDDGTPQFHAKDLEFLNRIMESRNFTIAIDRCYRLDQIVEAHRYVGKGHKKGNVIVNVAQGVPS